MLHNCGLFSNESYRPIHNGIQYEAITEFEYYLKLFVEKNQKQQKLLELQVHK